MYRTLFAVLALGVVSGCSTVNPWMTGFRPFQFAEEPGVAVWDGDPEVHEVTFDAFKAGGDSCRRYLAGLGIPDDEITSNEALEIRRRMFVAFGERRDPMQFQSVGCIDVKSNAPYSTQLNDVLDAARRIDANVLFVAEMFIDPKTAVVRQTISSASDTEPESQAGPSRDRADRDCGSRDDTSYYWTLIHLFRRVAPDPEAPKAK